MQRQIPMRLNEWKNKLITLVITDDLAGLERLALAGFVLSRSEYEDLVIKAATHHAVNVLNYLLNKNACGKLMGNTRYQIRVNDNIFTQYVAHLNDAASVNDAVDYNYNLFNEFQPKTEFDPKKEQAKLARKELIYSSLETPTEVLDIICRHMKTIDDMRSKRAKVIKIMATKRIKSIYDEYDDVEYEEQIKIIDSALSFINTTPYLNENDRKKIMRKCILSIIKLASSETLSHFTPFIEATGILQSIKVQYHNTLNNLLNDINNHATTPSITSNNGFVRFFVNAFSKDEVAESCQMILNQYFLELNSSEDDDIFSQVQLLHKIIIKIFNECCNGARSNDAVKEMMESLLYKLNEGTHGVLRNVSICCPNGNFYVSRLVGEKIINYFKQLDAKHLSEKKIQSS